MLKKIKPMKVSFNEPFTEPLFIFSTTDSLISEESYQIISGSRAAYSK